MAADRAAVIVTDPPVDLLVTRHAAIGCEMNPMPPSDESAMPPQA